jgi:crotonobetainyl-CoA:carnitine CoA-transferase CaiB-like acyl-CoA transferase
VRIDGMTMPAGALAGLRVLDLSILFSAPQVSTVLGDFGADVVKIEPPSGDPMRSIGPVRAGESLNWALVNRNKRCIELDMTTPEGQATLHRLVAVADVVVENAGAAVLRKWRATWEELSAINPGLVMVSVSIYGEGGPYEGRPGNGTLAEAFGGFTAMTGEADGPPMLPSVPLGDVLAAMWGVVGALLACWSRDASFPEGRAGSPPGATRAAQPGQDGPVSGPDVDWRRRDGVAAAVSGAAMDGGAASQRQSSMRGTGRGQHVDIAMYDPILFCLSGTLAQYDGPGTTPPGRTGSRVPGGVPRNVYLTGDGHYIAVSAPTDQQVARLLPLLGLDTPEGRARYARSADRLKVADELDGLVAGWIAGLPRDEVVDALIAERIPAAPVNDVISLLADRQIRGRGDLVEVDVAGVGPRTFVRPSPRLSATPGEIRSTGPALGAHTAEVLADWLGERSS